MLSVIFIRNCGFESIGYCGKRSERYVGMRYRRILRFEAASTTVRGRFEASRILSSKYSTQALVVCGPGPSRGSASGVGAMH